MASSFGIRIWGARGSLPRRVRGQERHGGNTVCLEVLHQGPQHVILDAGTGLPNLGTKILNDSPLGTPIHLFLSHYHWDHILGLPLFGPVYREGFDISLYGIHSDQGALREMLDMVFNAAYSPIYGPENLLSNLILPPEAPTHELDGLRVDRIDIPGVHPGGCQVLRVSQDSKSIVYAPDIELRGENVIDAFIETCTGCDLLVCGTPLTQAQFEKAVGVGHSSLSVAHEVACRAGVKRFMAIHFDPLTSDGELDQQRRDQQAKIPHPPIDLACEGQEVLF